MKTNQPTNQTTNQLTTILAIESSCDETACAVVQKKPDEDFATVLSSVTATSLAKHKATKGIVPEVAAREQLKVILPVITEAIQRYKDAETQRGRKEELHKKQDRQSANPQNRTVPISNIQSLISNIDFIAVTTGPGLIGSLLVGIETARSLAYAWNLPIIPVNHIQAHPYANFISQKSLISLPEGEKAKATVRAVASEGERSLSQSTSQPTFPLLSWVISGGHTELFLMKSHTEIERLGGTVDDAAGECFDKCARVLGFDYPGGPFIEKLASQLTPNNLPLPSIKLPRPMIHEDTFNMSFSGLKSAFLRKYEEIHKIPYSQARNSRVAVRDDKSDLNSLSLSSTSDQQSFDNLLAWELQEAISDVIVAKTKRALEKYSEIQSIIISGGVAANSRIREKLEKLWEDIRYQISDIGNSKSSPLSESSSRVVHFPSLTYCTDNAAMIGAYAAFHINNATDWKNISVKLD